MKREEMLDMVADVLQQKISVNNRGALEKRPEVPQITEETRFDELNIDSLDKVELLMAIEEELSIEIADEEADLQVTVGDMLTLVESKL